MALGKKLIQKIIKGKKHVNATVASNIDDSPISWVQKIFGIKLTHALTTHHNSPAQKDYAHNTRMR